MTSVINQFALAAGGSLAASILVKVTVTLLLALAGVWFARRSRAAVRHALLAAMFGVLLALPAASTLAPPVRMKIPAAAPERIEPERIVTIEALPAAVDPHPEVDFAPAAPRSLPSLSMVLFAVWIAGAILFLLPVIAGLWQVRALRRDALEWPRGQSILEGLVPGSGVRRRVEVSLHRGIQGPMTCGLTRPAILFAPDAQMWTEGDVTRAITHEVEHVRRGDWLTHCIARAVCAVYWFHPLVWMAWRRLVLEAERACDDAVLQRAEATAYADQLVGLAQRLSTAAKSPLLAMANRADLAKRVGALLDARQRRGRAGVASITLTCAGAAALVLIMSPLRTVAAFPLDTGAKVAAREAIATVPSPVAAAVSSPVASALPSPRTSPSVGTRVLPVRMVAAAYQAPAPDTRALPVAQFHASTALVVVDVVVRDHDGNNVEGLTASDFAVTEDDVPQRISVFEYQRLPTRQDAISSYYILGYYTRNESQDDTFRQIYVSGKQDKMAKLEFRTGYNPRRAFRAGASQGAPALSFTPLPGAKAPNGAGQSSADRGADQKSDPNNSPPLMMVKVEPEYSEEARKAKWQGSVELLIDVDSSGQPGNIKVVHPLGLGLDEKAMEAVAKWRFRPATQDGKPVATQTRVTVDFRLW